ENNIAEFIDCTRQEQLFDWRYGCNGAIVRDRKSLSLFDPVRTVARDLFDLHHAHRARDEVVAPVFDDVFHDLDIKLPVLMNEDIAEADHAFKQFREFLRYESFPGQHGEGRPTLLRDPEFPDPDDVVGKVDAEFRRSLDVHRYGIPSEIVLLEGKL